jgi:hypothetical protein
MRLCAGPEPDDGPPVATSSSRLTMLGAEYARSISSYLHDHLAGSKFAMELLEKLASGFAGVKTGDVARELLEQVRLDRKTLEQLGNPRDSLHVRARSVFKFSRLGNSQRRRSAKRCIPVSLCM